MSAAIVVETASLILDAAIALSKVAILMKQASQVIADAQASGIDLTDDQVEALRSRRKALRAALDEGVGQ